VRRALPVVLLLCGCTGALVAEPSRVPQQLRDELASIEAPLNPRDDYWTEHLGDYLTPAEMRHYWTTPEEQRFHDFGRRWLEFALREDLLGDDRAALSPEELEELRGAPDYDATKRALERTLERSVGERDQ
jgi:hypothetical protein